MISASTPFFLKGMTLGLSAALSPGPMMFLIISQTIQYNWREGFKVAIVPVITDLPIIFFCWLLLSRFSRFDSMLAFVSFAGAWFLLRMAWANWNASPPRASDAPCVKPGSFGKGILTNFLSPNPYLFWLTVGTPIVLQANHSAPGGGAAFVTGMYAILVLTQMAIALVALKSSALVSGAGFRIFLRGTSIALGLFALAFVREGLTRLGLHLAL